MRGGEEYEHWNLRLLRKVASYAALVERLPEDSTLVLHGVPWEDYEGLLKAVGETKRFRISYDSGKLQIMTTSAEQENHVMFLKKGLIFC